MLEKSATIFFSGLVLDWLNLQPHAKNDDNIMTLREAFKNYLADFFR